jgi:hypothetical protein
MSARSPESDQSGTKEQEFRSRSVYTSPQTKFQLGEGPKFLFNMGQGDCLLGRTLTTAILIISRPVSRDSSTISWKSGKFFPIWSPVVPPFRLEKSRNVKRLMLAELSERLAHRRFGPRWLCIHVSRMRSPNASRAGPGRQSCSNRQLLRN